MNNRSQNGGTLALVAVSAIIIIMIGIGFFVVLQLFGGGRELQHASDAGNLNVAKQAIATPSVSLNLGNEQDNFKNLGDPTVGGQVNLRTFNRCVGQALLVAINAQNEATPTATANAQTVYNAVEGPGAIAERLHDALVGSSVNFFGFFLNTGKSNSLRMLGANPLSGTTYRSAYMEQTAQDTGATNLQVYDSLKALLAPYGLVTSKMYNGTMTNFMRGYVSAAVGTLQIVGVPVQPGDQPHMVSPVIFNSLLNLPFASPVVPPNAFEVTGKSTEMRTLANAVAQGNAEVGSLDAAYPLSFPLGYIDVINAPASSQGNGSNTASGQFPSLNNTLNNQLLEGIVVNGNTFGTSDQTALIDQWTAYNANPVGPQPPTAGLFNLAGNPATPADAASIGSGSVMCNDVSVSNNPSTQTQPCQSLFANGVFDKAYGGGSFAQPGSATDLMAAECVKCQVEQEYARSAGAGGPGAPNPVACKQTGLRVYFPNDPGTGAVAPDTAANRCVISQPGTIKALWDQTNTANNGSSWDTVYNDPTNNGIKLRVQQIKPEATDAEILGLFSGASAKTLLLGEHCYIYMSNPLASPPDRTLIVSDTPPSGRVGSGATPDGTAQTTWRDYSLVGTVANAPGDAGIHDALFQGNPGTNALQAEDRASWTPASGFDNCLGQIQFTNNVLVQSFQSVTSGGGIGGGAPPAPCDGLYNDIAQHGGVVGQITPAGNTWINGDTNILADGTKQVVTSVQNTSTAALMGQTVYNDAGSVTVNANTQVVTGGATGNQLSGQNVTVTEYSPGGQPNGCVFTFAD